MPADPVVSPAATIQRAREHAGYDSMPEVLREPFLVLADLADALLAVGERDKAEIEALTAAVEGLLDVGQRSRSGDPSLDPEEWYAIRDYAQKVLKDDGTASALRESRERDRRQIARLTEVGKAAQVVAELNGEKRSTYGRPVTNVEWQNALYHLETAVSGARAVLAGEEDAGDE